ncbi:MAG TPA: polysaccharide biosynthesis tyrosine autokinase, partial [Anaeromyxobacteraceae bacterium]|nr:polysaccharide biosynthesis tyrosine autokinase [Anaeromyxobacteraceae bacterium]
AAVRRAKWAVLFITVLGTAAGVLATRWLEPRYRAKAILWIEGSTGKLVFNTGDEAVKAAGWTELVSSNAVLDSAVGGLRLYLSPATPADSAALTTFRLRSDRVRSGAYRLTVDGAGARYALETETGVVERGAVGDTIGRNLGFAWVPPREALAPGRPVSFTLKAPSVAAQELATALKLHPDPEGKFLRIELRGTNPSLTAATVNAVADRAVSVAAELERQTFEELADILREQYDSAVATLRAAERDLEQYQVRNADVLQAQPPELLGLPDAGGDPAFARSFEMRVNLEQLRRDRRTLEQVIGQAQSGQARLDALPVIGAVRESPRVQEALEAVTQKQAELRALRHRYTDASAPVQLLTAEIDSLQRRTLPALLGAVAAELSAREAALTPQVREAFGHLRRVPTLALEQARRSRDVTAALEHVAQIRQRYDAMRLAVAGSLPAMRVLDPAIEPRRPDGDYGSLLIALSFATSLGLAVVGVTLRDRADTRVRFPEQITHGMRLEILGAMPHLSRRSAQADGDAEVIEALRGLRLRVLHAHGAGGPLTLTVTSPAMGDGKSIVSANLALSFAHAGYETLLIDGDLRRGNQHGVLGERSRPGLTDLLAGQATADTAIRETRFAGLSLLPTGTRMMRAPELLLSPDLNTLIGRFRERYSVVIVDSPPLAAGVDPIVLGTATRDLLLVLRSGATDLALTISKLEVLETLPLRVLGAVLNDVRASGAFRYYTYDVTGYVQPDPGFAAVGPDGQTRFLGGRS